MPPISDVGDAMREMKSGSTHIRSRAQAIAVGLKYEGKSRDKSSKSSKRSKRRRITGARTLSR